MGSGRRTSLRTRKFRRSSKRYQTKEKTQQHWLVRRTRTSRRKKKRRTRNSRRKKNTKNTRGIAKNRSKVPRKNTGKRNAENRRIDVRKPPAPHQLPLRNCLAMKVPCSL